MLTGQPLRRPALPALLPAAAAGLNPLFDTFDCQEHYFASPEPGKCRQLLPASKLIAERLLPGSCVFAAPARTSLPARHPLPSPCPPVCTPFLHHTTTLTHATCCVPPAAGKVYAKINWRIPLTDPLDGDLDFAERSTMQRFVQASGRRRRTKRSAAQLPARSAAALAAAAAAAAATGALQQQRQQHQHQRIAAHLAAAAPAPAAAAAAAAHEIGTLGLTAVAPGPRSPHAPPAGSHHTRQAVQSRQRIPTLPRRLVGGCVGGWVGVLTPCRLFGAGRGGSCDCNRNLRHPIRHTPPSASMPLTSLLPFHPQTSLHAPSSAGMCWPPSPTSMCSSTTGGRTTRGWGTAAPPSTHGAPVTFVCVFPGLYGCACCLVHRLQCFCAAGWMEACWLQCMQATRGCTGSGCHRSTALRTNLLPRPACLTALPSPAGPPACLRSTSQS